MKYRPLGRTGIEISEIGVGAWQLGGPLKLDGKTDGHPELGRDYCIDLIHACGDLGINFIDTAEQYGNGESELRVGDALQGRRDQWIIGTKFGYQVGPRGERLSDASPRHVPISLEGSLRRLRTDHIDLYVYHCAPKAEEAEEVAAILADAKRKGQVRAVGISTGSAAHLPLLLSLGCLDVVQFPHSILDPQTEIRAFLQEHGIGGVVRGAFAGGRLSGRYFHSAPRFSEDDIRSNWASDAAAAAAEFARYAVFEELLTPERGMIQLALRFLLDEPTTQTIIPGGKSLEDYRNAIAATEIPPLTAEERVRVEQLRERLTARK